MYYLYILECADQTLYTGITKNIDKRIEQHNNDMGAKYTRGRGPVVLMYSKQCNSRSSATKKEIRIKKMSKNEKLQLIKMYNEKK